MKKRMLLISGILFSLIMFNLSGCSKDTDLTLNEDKKVEDKDLNDEINNKVNDVDNIIVDKIPVETEGDRAGSSTKIYLGSEKPYETGGKRGQVKTRYGNHNYGCKTQAEYDEVMRIVDDFVANLSEDDIKEHINWKLYQLFLREQNMEDITDDLNQTVTLYSNSNNTYTDFELSSLYDAFLHGTKSLKAGLKGAINQEEFETAVKLTIILGEYNNKFITPTTDPKDGSPSSAYDTLVRGVSDCDADAHTKMALLDRLGFNTALIADYTSDHGWGDVKLGKYWWGFDTFSPTTKKLSSLTSDDLSVHVEPTYNIPNS